MPALFFDCDGVLADTERFGHRPAFNESFAQEGLPVRSSEADYVVKLWIGVGKECMASLLTDDSVREHGLPTDPEGQRELLARWHRMKTAAYTARVQAGEMPARRGIARIVDEALAAGSTPAVASTSAEESVRAPCSSTQWGRRRRRTFSVPAGDVVPAKKPDPSIYTLARTGADPNETAVVEDSRNGLLSAVGAGLRCVVTVSSYITGRRSLVRKFVNDPLQFVPEMLKGVALSNPTMLRCVPEYDLIRRADAPRDDKVSIMQGSGSGREPAHVRGASATLVKLADGLEALRSAPAEIAARIF